MKAILGNFNKISETEFRLKKDLQFADVSIDEDRVIQTVNYQDAQNILVGDILTHEDRDYEIKSINTDNIKYITVMVSHIQQPYSEAPKPKFIARQMSPPKPRPKPLKVVEASQEIDEGPYTFETDEEVEKLEEVITPGLPKKQSYFKKFLSYVGKKLVGYSDS